MMSVQQMAPRRANVRGRGRHRTGGVDITKRMCSIDGCDRSHYARSWCSMHYQRWLAHGDPEHTEVDYLHGTPEERLAAKLETDGDCRVFTGYTNEHGYGRLKVDDSMPFAHRLAYELWVQPIPDGLQVLHRCDNPPCCNPEHLFVGTHQDNMQDMVAKERHVPGRGDPGPALRRRAAQLRRRRALQAGFPPSFKRCPQCGEFQHPDAFGPNRGRPDGLQTYCRPCSRERRRDG